MVLTGVNHFIMKHRSFWYISCLCRCSEQKGHQFLIGGSYYMTKPSAGPSVIKSTCAVHTCWFYNTFRLCKPQEVVSKSPAKRQYRIKVSKLYDWEANSGIWIKQMTDGRKIYILHTCKTYHICEKIRRNRIKRTSKQVLQRWRKVQNSRGAVIIWWA